jgi:hypothetical protein
MLYLSQRINASTEIEMGMEHDPTTLMDVEENESKIARETQLQSDDYEAIDLDPTFKTNFSTQRALT